MRPLLLLVVLAVSHAVAPRVAAAPAGDIRFFAIADFRFDVYTLDPTDAEQDWMRRHYWRMLTYSPYFDARLRSFPDAWVYKDLCALYEDSDLAEAHPEWILHDASGNRLYIPYACGGGRCPQYAADPGNPAFRARWIADAAATLGAGYRGLFVDDVNLLLDRVSDGMGVPVLPEDPRTGAAMTEANWRRYLAEFTEQIRAAFPAAEIVHNALWFVGDDDPAVRRQVLAADWINLERGVNDRGIVDGVGPYGFETFLAHIDWIHALGRHVLFDTHARTKAQREYGLATYFLTNGGDDALGNERGGNPKRWWRGYETSLGDAIGGRYAWQGLLRRDFAHGSVLVSPPGGDSLVVSLDGPYVDLRGHRRTTIRLRSPGGAVLRTPEVSATGE